MDLRQQDAIKNLAQKCKNEIAVILGFTDIELIEIITETLTTGDPSGAGSLAGVELSLTVFHILESGFKKIIPPDIWEEQLGLMETIAGPEKIEAIDKLMERMREK